MKKPRFLQEIPRILFENDHILRNLSVNFSPGFKGITNNSCVVHASDLSERYVNVSLSSIGFEVIMYYFSVFTRILCI